MIYQNQYDKLYSNILLNANIDAMFTQNHARTNHTISLKFFHYPIVPVKSNNFRNKEDSHKNTMSP